MSNVERIFGHSTTGQGAGDFFGTADNIDGSTATDAYTAKFKALVSDCIDYEESYLAPARDQASKYYYGQLPSTAGDNYSTSILTDPGATYDDLLNEGDSDSNRSTYVSTDVRDVVLGALPALIRIYASSENVVSIQPRTQADVDVAQQAQEYIDYLFWNENPGFLILQGAFKDAMTVRTGFVKWWTDDSKCYETKTFTNLSEEAVLGIANSAPNVQLVDHGTVDPITNLVDTVVFKFVKDVPQIKVAGVPPWEMRIDRYAAVFNQSRIVGHERAMARDLINDMRLIDTNGNVVDDEYLTNFVTTSNLTTYSDERQLTNPGLDASRRINDGVIFGEWYVYMDHDGDGYSELRYIRTLGEDREIITDEPANRIKFAMFSCDPTPHAVVGQSLADLTIPVQMFNTNLGRGMLDNLVDTLNPRMVVNEIMVNIDDIMNDDLGAIVRTRGDPANTVQYTQIPFVGQSILPVMSFMNDVRDRRTGITDAAKGLDPKALQSSTQIGVDAVINGAQERVELIARTLAETGFRDLFTGLYNEVCENPNQKRTLKINGKWTSYDTGLFTDASSGVTINANMGKGSDAVKLAVLQGIQQAQQQVYTQFGPGNPVVGVQELLNTQQDILKLSGIANPERYFKTPPPEVLQQIAQQPATPDPMTIAAQANMENVKSKTAIAVSTNAQKQLQFQQQQQLAERKQELAEHQALVQQAQTNKRLEIEQQHVALENKKIEMGALKK